MSNETVCDKCYSTNIQYDKLLGLGYVGYRAKCLDCGRRRHIKRTKEIFDKVKNLEWKKSKKLLEKETLNTLF